MKWNKNCGADYGYKSTFCFEIHVRCDKVEEKIETQEGSSRRRPREKNRVRKKFILRRFFFILSTWRPFPWCGTGLKVSADSNWNQLHQRYTRYTHTQLGLTGCSMLGRDRRQRIETLAPSETLSSLGDEWYAIRCNRMKGTALRCSGAHVA